jgi:prolipoprotein diacylglyceryltransferase
VPLYESLWAILMVFLLPYLRQYWQWPNGMMFRIFFSGYCLWRLGIDSLKPAPPITEFGLSAIQWAALITLCIYVPLSWRWRKRQFKNMDHHEP